MKTINIVVAEESVKFKDDIRNFMVSSVDYDLGDPVGVGATEQDAIEDYKEMWMLTYGEEIDVNTSSRIIRH